MSHPSDTPGFTSKESINEVDVPSPNSGDIEAVGEKPGEVSRKASPREGISTLKWVLSLIGLYLGALLYGIVY